MSTLAFLAAVSTAPAPSTPTWRLIDRAELHVGVRPAAYWCPQNPEFAAGFTVQVTVSWP